MATSQSARDRAGCSRFTVRAPRPLPSLRLQQLRGPLQIVFARVHHGNQALLKRDAVVAGALHQVEPLALVLGLQQGAQDHFRAVLILLVQIQLYQQVNGCLANAEAGPMP